LSLQSNDSHPTYGWRFYKDPSEPGYHGTDCEGYCVYNKVTDPVRLGAGGANTATLGDIVEYRDPKHDEPQDELVCAVTEFNYPNYKLEDIYPLRRIHFLGASILVPANTKAFLSWYQHNDENTVYSKCDVQEYDPCPFLLSHLHNPLLELHCKAPVRDADELSIKKIGPSNWNDVSVIRPTVYRASSNDKEQATIGVEYSPYNEGTHAVTDRPSDFPVTESSSCFLHVHNSHVFNPEFELPNERGTFTRAIAGRFEMLAIPPSHSQHLSSSSGPAALVDELMWLGKSALWNEMVGCFFEPGDSVLIPPFWAFRFRVILGTGASPAMRLATTV
jgi:hypothetical protein